jgi:Skp family chaperone for outer membrane proteins
MRVQGWMSLAALLAVGSISGCGWQNDAPNASAAGAVAVIDLDEIARRLGSDKQMAEAIAQRENALSKQLVELAQSYSAQIAEQKAKLPASDQQEVGVTLASWEQQANASLNQVKQRAAADLQNHRMQMVQKFRDQIKPTARGVAQSRGLSVIVTKNDSVVFDYTSGVDITDAVVDELLASSTAAPPVTPASAATPSTTTPQQAAASEATTK